MILHPTEFQLKISLYFCSWLSNTLKSTVGGTQKVTDHAIAGSIDKAVVYV